MLELNSQAPDFELPDQNGNMRKLSDFKGKKVVLYFYPKDNTSGCTKQACGFSLLSPKFQEKNAVVIGVSKDSVASHKRFEEKQNLSIILLSDPETKVLQEYGVWQEKTMCGRTGMGVVRSTYIIDEEGKIINVSEKVKADKNPNDTLELL